MLEDGRISYIQIILLMSISRFVLPVTYLPALHAPPENQDVWISGVLSFPVSLLLAIPIYYLIKKFPNQTIIQCCQNIAGKPGTILALMYIWLFIDSAAITLMQICYFLTTAVMAETPILFFQISMLLLCVYTARSGLEVLGRLAELFAPIIIFGMFLMYFLAIKDMDVKALMPVLEKGLYPVLHGSLTIAARTIEIVGLAMMAPYLKEQGKIKDILLISGAIVCVIFFLLPASVVGVFGAEEAKNLNYPFYSMVCIINIGNFIENIQAVHMAVWLLGVFLRITLDFYFALLGIGQLLHLKTVKPLAFPLAIIIIVLGLVIAPNFTVLRDFLSYKNYTWYTLLFIVFIPCFLLLLTAIKQQVKRSC